MLKTALLEDQEIRQTYKNISDSQKKNKKFQTGIPASVSKPIFDANISYEIMNANTMPTILFENKKKDTEVLNEEFQQKMKSKTLYKKNLDSDDFINRDKKECNIVMKFLSGTDFVDDDNKSVVTFQTFVRKILKIIFYSFWNLKAKIFHL